MELFCSFCWKCNLRKTQAFVFPTPYSQFKIFKRNSFPYQYVQLLIVNKNHQFNRCNCLGVVVRTPFFQRKPSFLKAFLVRTRSKYYICLEFQTPVFGIPNIMHSCVFGIPNMHVWNSEHVVFRARFARAQIPNVQSFRHV